jgi:hypothetical protein
VSPPFWARKKEPPKGSSSNVHSYSVYFPEFPHSFGHKMACALSETKVVEMKESMSILSLDLGQIKDYQMMA